MQHSVYFGYLTNTNNLILKTFIYIYIYKELLIVQPLKQIQSKGPITVVGETWGGTIAVELTKILEGFGETVVNLILLDGCPSDNKKRLKLLDNVDFEILSENSKKKVYT